MIKIFLKNINNLTETQNISFYNFLYNNIKNELKLIENPLLLNKTLNYNNDNNINNSLDKIDILLYLYINNLKFIGPNKNIDYCLKYNKSYTLNIYLLCKFLLPYYDLKVIKEYDIIYLEDILDYIINNNIININFNKYNNNEFIFNQFINNKLFKYIKIKQYIHLIDIPLITDEGTFIIDGCEKIVISQLIKSPGIYFSKNCKNYSYETTIISNNNLWFKLLLDNNNNLYFNIENNNKELYNNNLFLLFILYKYNISLKEIFNLFKYSKYIKFLNFINNVSISLNNIIILNNILLNNSYEYFYIGENGRYILNNKLNLNIPKKIQYLTIYDIIKIINELFNLKYNNNILDDIDHIKNKIIRSVGELLQYYFHINISNGNIFKKDFKKNIIYLEENENTCKKNFLYNNNIINSYILTYNIKSFFLTSNLSQYMDETNSLSEIIHKRKISLFGPNGLNNNNVSISLRDIHSSQYGRICPIETSEGINAGLISILTLYSRVNYLGMLETPYFFINKNNIFINKKPIYLNSEQDSKLNIIYDDPNIYNNKLSIKKNYNFLNKNFNNINFILLSPLQIISLGIALIPFLEHNDGNRALMGSHMQKQALTLLYKQKPIIGTGLESIAIINSNMILKSYSEGIVIISSSSLIEIKDYLNQNLIYYLKKNKKSNQDTYLNNQSIVWTGEKVYSNQIIADNSDTLDGELTLGKNLIVAYMNWYGYNYEDAIVINEKLLIENILTSINIKEIFFKTNSNFNFFNKDKKLKNNINYSLKHLNNYGIIKIGSYIKEDDILINNLIYNKDLIKISKYNYTHKIKLKYRNKTNEYNFLSKINNNFYYDICENKKLILPDNTSGKIIDINIISNYNHKSDSFDDIIIFYIAQYKKIKVGDKLSGRHGNKGVIAKILSDKDMPFLPNGKTIDIILNPLGVPSRMNIGQIFECLLGFAGINLGYRFKIYPFDEIYGKYSSRVLINQKLKEASIYKNLKWLFNIYFPGKILLRDGKTGEFFDNPITVGVSYILKLIHIVDDKMYSRSIGDYQKVTNQPIHGKSKKGGQRFGEMEIWALEAYGCSNTLKEFISIKSDDINIKEIISLDIIENNEISKSYISESFLILIRELNSMGISLSLNIIYDYNLKFKNIKFNIFNQIENVLKFNYLSKYKYE